MHSNRVSRHCLQEVKFMFKLKQPWKESLKNTRPLWHWCSALQTELSTNWELVILWANNIIIYPLRYGEDTCIPTSIIYMYSFICIHFTSVSAFMGQRHVSTLCCFCSSFSWFVYFSWSWPSSKKTTLTSMLSYHKKIIEKSNTVQSVQH